MIEIDYGKPDSVLSTWIWIRMVTGTLLISPYWVEEQLVDILSTTTYSLSIWNYLITEKMFITLLKNLAVLWVDIGIILENLPYWWDDKAFLNVQDKLVPLWVELQSDDQMWTNFVHAKTFVLDESTYIISTANLTYPSLWRNREYRFVGEDDLIAWNLQDLFEKDTLWEKIEKEDIHEALLICPIDCRDDIQTAINSATKTIKIETQYIQDDELVRLLEDKQAEWIDVQVIIWAYQDEWRLDSLWTGVRQLTDPYLHAKNILIDERLLIMWSMNLSTNGLDNNREIWITITDPFVISQFVSQFERDWKDSDLFTWP